MNIQYDEKKKRYYSRITLGYNNVGNRIQKRVFAQTKREMHSQIASLIKRFESGEFDVAKKKSENLNFENVAEEWLSEHVAELSINTRDSYTARMNRILDNFSGRLVAEISTRDIRIFLKGLQEEGLAPETTNTYRSILSSLFAYAVRNKYVSENPVSVIKQFRMPKKEIHTFDSLQLTSYLNGCKELAEEEANHGNYVALKTAAYTGMRIGEVLALRWSDIDFENATIRVAHSLSYSTKDKCYSLDGTKNKRVRHVTISNDLVQTLKWYKMQWMFLVKKMRNEPEPTFANLVFLTIEGKPKHRSYLRHWHKRVLKEKGLPKDFRIHDLRHTHATLLLEIGEHPKVVQERLGHKDISVTMDMYTHVTMTLQKQTAETFGALMDQKLSNE
ncbi:tyrosine-type recombinase/integrase [Exiguobacterium aestuarii]|uniref:tyrosine-type recombinase/integrase n=1 Tax=Exiguobacterium aestuarii TaxID=273527 RepID=UPI001CD7A1F2|nr:tyrosine-type recombinase/integrase [Exiguobacterium aestuarii]MCA0980258.1 tyrosine-type recombinase/integrase [Exiguobacterium aestuarii]